MLNKRETFVQQKLPEKRIPEKYCLQKKKQGKKSLREKGKQADFAFATI